MQIPGVHYLQGVIGEKDTLQRLLQVLKGRKADVVSKNDQSHKNFSTQNVHDWIHSNSRYFFEDMYTFSLTFCFATFLGVE